MGRTYGGNSRGWKLQRMPRSEQEMAARRRLIAWLRANDLSLSNGRVSRHAGYRLWVDHDIDPCLNYSKWKRIVLQAQTNGDLPSWRGATEPAEPTRLLFMC